MSTISVSPEPLIPLRASWGTTGRPRFRTAQRLLRRNLLGSLSLAVLLALALIALASPWIAPFNPERSMQGLGLKPPNSIHWFGTDQLGRDVLSRVMVGARISLFVGFAVALGGTVLGTVVGVVSGYLGGKTDLFIQRVIDSLSALPALVLAMLFMVVLGQSVVNVVLALSLVNSPRVARTVRSVVLSVKEHDYILASRALGAASPRIMRWHVLPNCMASILIMTSAAFGWAIVVESSLSFLGLGVPPNVPSWGGMLGGQAQQYVRTAPWTAVFPGLVLSVAVLAANLLGDTLRDVLDPRMSER